MLAINKYFENDSSRDPLRRKKLSFLFCSVLKKTITEPVNLWIGISNIILILLYGTPSKKRRNKNASNTWKIKYRIPANTRSKIAMSFKRKGRGNLRNLSSRVRNSVIHGGRERSLSRDPTRLHGRTLFPRRGRDVFRVGLNQKEYLHR